MFYTSIIWIEFICLLLALFFINNKKAGWLRNFIWLLSITVITESAGYCVYFLLQKNNHWVFNAFMPVDFFFTNWILYKICSPHFNCKPWIIIVLAVFSILYVIESINSHFLEYSSISGSVKSIVIISISFLYYYYLLKQDEYIDITKDPPFWIVTGCFFFYFGGIACDFFFDYLVTINNTTLKPVRYIIYIVLNFILYSCWSYAFICKYRQTISSS